MKEIRKISLVVIIVFLISVYSYHLKISSENKKIFSDLRIWQTDNLENIISMYERPPTEAARLYAFALTYREESLKSRTPFMSKIDLPTNYLFCSDRRIVNLLFPYIFQNDNTACEYNLSEDKFFEKLKDKFEESNKNAAAAQNNNPIDFSGKDETKWFQENSIIPPTTPYAGYWETFFLDLNKLPKLSPPNFGSKEDTEEVENVKIALQNTTKQQKEKVEYWAGGKGTPTPVGIWFRIIEENYSSESPLTLLKIKKDASLAGYDAAVTCWNMKFNFMTKRPFMRDEEIVSQIMTPNFPSYPSGHATMSGAISTVLEQKYPIVNKKGFFYDLAQEAANSRLWGGIHFDIDNQDGLEIGKFIGQEFLKTNYR